MKKNNDGLKQHVETLKRQVNENYDPGVSLFWLDDSFDSVAPMPKTPPQPRVPEQMQEDSAIRSVMKTISRRLLATMTTVMLIYALTDDGDLAMTVGYLDVTLKTGLYYFHERIWNRLRVGMTKIRA